jgi:hypothetical protein
LWRELSIFADSPTECRLQRVHARQAEKVPALLYCDAAERGAARIKDIVPIHAPATSGSCQRREGHPRCLNHRVVFPEQAWGSAFNRVNRKPYRFLVKRCKIAN